MYLSPIPREAKFRAYCSSLLVFTRRPERNKVARLDLNNDKASRLARGGYDFLCLTSIFISLIDSKKLEK